MKKLILLFLLGLLVCCTPNKRSIVKVIYVGGQVDTLIVEYRSYLKIDEYLQLKDSDGNVRARGVLSFSVIKTDKYE